MRYFSLFILYLAIVSSFTLLFFSVFLFFFFFPLSNFLSLPTPPFPLLSPSFLPPPKNRTRRRWLPNVHSHRYYSFILDREMDIKVTSKAMRTIDKVIIFFRNTFLIFFFQKVKKNDIFSQKHGDIFVCCRLRNPTINEQQHFHH